jgi:hypothetical protein
MRMEFVLQQKTRSRKENYWSKRNKRFSKIVAEGLNNDIIKLRSIEAFLNYLNQVIQKS